MFRILCFSILFFFHPVHVTITSIDYVPENDLFRVFVRMYFDDFKSDYNLDAENGQITDFSSSNTVSKNVVESYMKRKLIFKVNDELLYGKLLDINIADNEISMNFEYKGGKRARSVSIKNLFMTNLYADMSNMLILRINDFEEGVKLTSEKTEQTFLIK
jgi:hypothetical protein